MEYGSVGIRPRCQVRAQALHARLLLGETISTVAESLFSRLSARGVPPTHIPGLIRDVCSILGDGGLFTPYLVNERLERLGRSQYRAETQASRCRISSSFTRVSPTRTQATVRP